MPSGAIPTLRGTAYKHISGTIGGATNNLNLDFSDKVSLGFNMQVTNDDSTNSISLKYNGNNNDPIVIKAGETQVIGLVPISSASLTNSSGSTISYRAFITGLPV